MKRELLIGLALAILSSPSVCGAVAISGDTSGSTEGLGNFSGSLTYNSASEQVAVSLTNTSPTLNGGFITGFVFNLPVDVSVSSFSSSTHSSFQEVGPGENAAPFGSFDTGAALGGNFIGGGNPNSGIGVGVTGQFAFDLKGSGLSSISRDSDFLSGSPSFVARFRGFEDGGSDKVPGNGTSVPEPATMLLLGFGLTAVGFGRKKGLGF